MESSVWSGLCAGKNQIHELAEGGVERNETSHVLPGKCPGRRGTEGIPFRGLSPLTELARRYLSAETGDTFTYSQEITD